MTLQIHPSGKKARSTTRAYLLDIWNNIQTSISQSIRMVSTSVLERMCYRLSILAILLVVIASSTYASTLAVYNNTAPESAGVGRAVMVPACVYMWYRRDPLVRPSGSL